MCQEASRERQSLVRLIDGSNDHFVHGSGR